MILIGYSGHAFVVYGILKNAGKPVTGYCDAEEKLYNPFQLPYFGRESDAAALQQIKNAGYFIAIGNNVIRKKLYNSLAETSRQLPQNAIHPSAIISHFASVSGHGIMISANAVINPLAKIGNGVICNTGCIIEHECAVGDFAHIGPSAVLCGNVTIGSQAFVGAGAIIRQGITIGENAMIGAGAVVVKDVPNGVTVMGCPAK
ncbi:MAG: acetyltransferase [Ferruginibacter sp.]